MRGMVFGEFVILAIVGMVFVLAITAKQNRRNSAYFDRKSCRRCGNVHPAHANFCGRCGQKL